MGRLQKGIFEDKSKVKDSFKGHILISTPSMDNSDVFSQSIIYVCEHNEEGAMGIVINREIHDISLADLMKNMRIPLPKDMKEAKIHFGGPVDMDHGFILHSIEDFNSKHTIQINSHLGITGSTEIVKKMAKGEGPKKSIFALGYAGWGAGQLEEEILNNMWIIIEADDDILFNTSTDKKWEKALEKLGIDPTALSETSGHA